MSGFAFDYYISVWYIVYVCVCVTINSPMAHLKLQENIIVRMLMRFGVRESVFFRRRPRVT